jgi:arsenate reductase
MTVTIYHNPACGTSRNVLALIRNSGAEPRVIEYLRIPPTRGELETLITRMGIAVRDLLRRTGTPHDELGLGDETLSDDALIDAMMAHPVLINRPIVVTPLGVKMTAMRMKNPEIPRMDGCSATNYGAVARSIPTLGLAKRRSLPRWNTSSCIR